MSGTDLAYLLSAAQFGARLKTISYTTSFPPRYRPTLSTDPPTLSTYAIDPSPMLSPYAIDLSPHAISLHYVLPPTISPYAIDLSPYAVDLDLFSRYLPTLPPYATSLRYLPTLSAYAISYTVSCLPPLPLYATSLRYLSTLSPYAICLRYLPKLSFPRPSTSAMLLPLTLRYAASRCSTERALRSPPYTISLRLCYTMSGTELAYQPMRCPVDGVLMTVIEPAVSRDLVRSETA
eukprot:695124-Rhodomonas_salina.4